MSHVPTTACHGPRRALPEQGAFEQDVLRIWSEVALLVVRASTVLGFAILAAAPVALAGIDSTAARNALVGDPAVRWQFDTGG